MGRVRPDILSSSDHRRVLRSVVIGIWNCAWFGEGDPGRRLPQMKGVIKRRVRSRWVRSEGGIGCETSIVVFVIVWILGEGWAGLDIDRRPTPRRRLSLPRWLVDWSPSIRPPIRRQVSFSGYWPVAGLIRGNSRCALSGVLIQTGEGRRSRVRSW